MTDQSDGPDGGDLAAGTSPEELADGDPTPDGLPIGRRDLLKWGVAGAVFDGSLFRSSGRLDTVSGADAEESGPRSVSMIPGARDYIPANHYPLSIRGIAPRGRSSSNVWIGNRRFSVRNLIADQGFNRRPVSLREITTPQKKGPALKKEDTGWKNWLKDYENSNAIEYKFSGRKQLIQGVARKADKTFRGVGSGHSHSEAAKPRRNYTDVKEITGELGLPYLREKTNTDYWNNTKVHRNHLIRLGAGTILKILNRQILPNHNPPLALPNMGSWTGQTLAGAINTSTHGTGLELGSFADLVRSVDMVTVPESPVASGESVVRMFRIEPSEGVTDPVEFGNNTDEHDMTLIQDDDIFRSAVVGYGSLGVAYAYTLELREPFWLREETDIKRWNSINPYRAAKKYRHYNFIVDLSGPQAAGTTNPYCRVRKRKEFHNGSKVTPHPDGPTERKDRSNIVSNIVDNVFEEFREFAQPENPKNQSQWQNPSNINDPRAFLRNAIQEIIRDVKAPFEKDRYKTASYIALRRTRATNLKPYTPPEPPKINALTVEIAVPARRVKPAVEKIIRLVQQDPRFFVAPLGVRFTGKSHQYLSPEYERPTAMLELIMPQYFDLRVPGVGDVYTPWADKINKIDGGYIQLLFLQKLKALMKLLNMEYFWKMGKAKNALEIIEDPLYTQFDGRPHMGKHNTLDVNASKSHKKPQNMYPEYGNWLEAFEYFNNFATFDAKFTDNKAKKRPNKRNP